MKLSDYIFSYLKEKQVRFVFMLPGGGAMHLVDSLGTSGIKYVPFLHEQAAAIAAMSYGEYTNDIGVCLVTSGPGATNAITGVAAAWIDSAPMMIISGQAKRSDLVGDKGVRQIGSQEVDIISLVKGITKYAVQVYEPESIRYHLERAYYEATTGRKGPVWLDIPMDVQAVDIDIDKQNAFYPLPSNQLQEFITGYASEIISIITEARKPLLLAGNGINSSGAQALFYKVIDILEIPVQTTWKAIDLIEYDHPLYVGHPGILGDRGANLIIQECDVLIAMGTRMDGSITAFNEMQFAPNAKKIVIDTDENEIKKYTMRIDYPICCDVRDVLQAMYNLLKERYSTRHSLWLAESKGKYQQYPMVTEQYKKADEYVSGYYFSEILSAALDEGATIVPESAGVTAEVFLQAFRIKRGQSLKVATGLGAMGFGLPYSIGACLAKGEKQTVLINGDGALQLNIQELETIRRLNLPIKIFVWNNCGYASIRNMQNINFDHRLVACDESSGLTLPDICSVADAYGIRTIRVCRNSEVKNAIDRVLRQHGPIVCELLISPTESISPKVMARIGKNGEMIPGTLDHMWPEI